MADESSQNMNLAGGLPVSGRVEIFPSNPLPDFNSVGGPAYVAHFRGGESASDLMGILCNTGLPARLDVVNSMRIIDHPGIVRYIDNGIVLWPQNNTRYCVLAYQRPLAPRLKTTIDEVHQPLGEDALNHYFLMPLMRGLIELQRAGVVHNAIRPTNIFWRLGGATSPQLGECLSAPAGYGQPVLFEPLERAMCNPTGRGPGHHVDDCYAFGVTLALMIIGQNPLQGMDDRAIVQMKIERGSFGALVGNHRISSTHIEILRGLLSDDSRQRWSASDLEQCLSGRRLTPKNTDAGRRAARAYSFAGGEYWQVRQLASAFVANVTEAVHAIETGSLDKWLRRAMGDDEKASALTRAVDSLKESGKTAHYEHQLITRVCITLDPAAPIRYRGLSAMPTGIADMLVETILSGNSTQVIGEIISSQLVTFWIEMQKDAHNELLPLGQQFERMKNLIEKPSFGNGIERVLYELNQGLPCLSPLLRSEYVTSPKTLLPALERLSSTPARPREPMDRHIAAFLVVRDRRSEVMFEPMTLPESSPKRGLALLTLCGELQYRHGPDSLPGLAQWLAPLVEPTIQRYLGKALRDKLREQMKEAVNRGDLNGLLRLIDDPRRIERDQQEFMAARILYLNILKEATDIEMKLNNREIVVRQTGKPMAASISTFLAIVLICIAIVRAVFQALS
jgi:eukaryotic-like serine/threonine-protein kinase